MVGSSLYFDTASFATGVHHLTFSLTAEDIAKTDTEEFISGTSGLLTNDPQNDNTYVKGEGVLNSENYIWVSMRLGPSEYLYST